MAEAPEYLRSRLKKLNEQLEYGQGLIADLEKAILLADSPTDARRYQGELDNSNELINDWEQQLFEVSSKIRSYDAESTSTNNELFNTQKMLDGLKQSAGQIQVIINQAGGTVVSGNQTNITASSGGSINMQNVNINSTLTNVQQTIGAMPGVGEDDKKKLNDLIEQLKKEIEKAPAEKQADVAPVAKNLDSLVQEAAKEEKDDEVIEIKGNRLKKAAENIAGALPAVAGIVGQILPFFIK